MCEAISIALTLASTAMSIVGEQYQARQKSNYAQAQLDAEAQLAANQQAVAEQNAQMEIQKGITERERYLRQSRAQQAQNASMIAAGGFEMDSGSNLSLLMDKAEETQHEANLITQNAQINAWNSMLNANNAANQQSMLSLKKEQNKVDNTALGLSMGRSALGAASSITKDLIKQQREVTASTAGTSGVK